MTARVLLADDDPMIRKALGASLTRAGFTVTTAEDGGQAIELSSTQTFDIVIADFNMGQIGGVAVVTHYKEKYALGVVCIVLSGDDDELTNAACYLAGADDVVVKPVSPAELRSRIVAATLAVRRTNAA